jgi:hypothetical protein
MCTAISHLVVWAIETSSFDFAQHDNSRLTTEDIHSHLHVTDRVYSADASTVGAVYDRPIRPRLTHYHCSRDEMQ